MINGSTGQPASQTWDGVVGTLMREEADVSFTDLSQSPERSAVIDITNAVMEQEYAFSIYGSSMLEKGITLKFGKSVTEESWLILIIFSLVMGLLVGVMFGIGPVNGLTSIVYLFFQQDPHMTLDRFPMARRVLLITCSLFFALVFAHFNANLTSLMTVPVQDNKLDSYGDILKYGYTVVTIRSSFQANVIQNAENQTNNPFHEISQDILKKGSGYLNCKEAFEETGKD